MRALLCSVVAASQFYQPMLRGVPSPVAPELNFQPVMQPATQFVPVFEDVQPAQSTWYPLGGGMLLGVAAALFLPANAPRAALAMFGTRATADSRAPEPEMNRVCDITGKRSNNANRVSFSNKKWAYWQQPNLQVKRLYSEELGRNVKLKIAVSTLRTIRKNGLDATAKKYGVDLSKF
jgi:large subunit ribosomal protein L28